MPIPAKETLTVEFKSESSRPQTDTEIIDNIVALANTQGGALYLGVEDDGTVTGVSQQHRNVNGLAALIFNSTVPPIPVRPEALIIDSIPVVKIEVDNSRQIISSSKGKTLQRRLKADGSPEVVPLFVSQFISRLSEQQDYDYSAQIANDSTLADLDPANRNALRTNIATANSHDPLLSLTDQDFDSALGLTTHSNGASLPTIAGILTIGTPESIKRSVPTASAVFQVMRNGSPRINGDPFVLPLVTMLPKVESMMEPWNPQHEIINGMLHTNIYDFDPTAFREAIVNAFCHRDYARMGSVRIMVDEVGLTISNPGGFVQGVSTDTLLTAQPQSRNPQLALIMKTAGYAERTGRGIDKIYAGSLSYGGSAPDYSDSNAEQVVLFLRRARPDRTFTDIVLREEQRRQAPLPIWTLVVLSLLYTTHGNLTEHQLRDLSHLDIGRINSAIDDLEHAGLVIASGTSLTRAYALNPKIPDTAGTATANPAITDAVEIPQKERIRMVTEHARRNSGTITTADVMSLLGLSYISAYRLLKRMEQSGLLTHSGRGPSSQYTLTEGPQPTEDPQQS